MNLLITRRRGYSKDVERIMTHKTNNLMLTTCYNAGWVRNNRYMTKKEALAVTSIGTTFKGLSSGSNRTFREFKYFTGVTDLPSLAFYNSTKLVAIELPNSITVIGSLAFHGSKIASNDFIIPVGVTTIGSLAFRSTSISKVTIPTTVTSMGGNAFNSSATKTVCWNASISPNVNETDFAYATTYLSDVYEVYDGMLFKNNMTTLFAVPISKTNVVIPNTVTTVASKACYYNKTNPMVLPDNVQVIGGSAFRSVKFGTYLILPDTVTSLGGNAFEYGDYRMVYIPSSCASWGSSVFANTPNEATRRIMVINRTTPPSGGNMYIFTCQNVKWELYVPVGATDNYPLKSSSGVFRTGYIQSVSEIPSTFDTTNKQTIKDSLDDLDTL